MMDRGTVETCKVSFQNKFEKLVYLVGFIIRIILAILVASFPPLCVMGNGYVFSA